MVEGTMNFKTKIKGCIVKGARYKFRVLSL